LPWLGEKGGLQLRFDFLNVINRVNLNGVDSSLGDGTFGRSTSTLPPRQIQLGARIYFQSDEVARRAEAQTFGSPGVSYM
jgi:hypothetical protein